MKKSSIFLALLVAPIASLALHSTEEFKLVASDGDAGDRFGCSVDVDDRTIVAGACRADALASGAGAAYVFVYDGTSFGETASMLVALAPIKSPAQSPGRNFFCCSPVPKLTNGIATVHMWALIENANPLSRQA